MEARLKGPRRGLTQRQPRRRARGRTRSRVVSFIRLTRPCAGTCGPQDDEVRRRLAGELLAAAKANDHAKCMELVDKGVPATAEELSRSGQCWSPLHWAAMHGNVPLVAALLDVGAAESYHQARKAAEVQTRPPPRPNVVRERRPSLARLPLRRARFRTTPSASDQIRHSTGRASRATSGPPGS